MKRMGRTLISLALCLFLLAGAMPLNAEAAGTSHPVASGADLSEFSDIWNSIDSGDTLKLAKGFAGTIEIPAKITSLTIDGQTFSFIDLAIDVKAAEDFELTLKEISFTSPDLSNAITYTGGEGKTLTIKTEGDVSLTGGSGKRIGGIYKGNGILLNSGNITIDGVCVISGGENYMESYTGTGIILLDGGKVIVNAAATIQGGEHDKLEKNTPNLAGCGIFINCTGDKLGSVVIAGDATIKGGNEAGGNGSCHGVYVKDGTIEVSGAANISGGVSTQGDRIGNGLHMEGTTKTNGTVITVSGKAVITGGAGTYGSSGNAVFAGYGDVVISGEAQLIGGDGIATTTNNSYSGNGIYAARGNIIVQSPAVITGGSNVNSSGEDMPFCTGVAVCAIGGKVEISGEAVLSGGKNCRGYNSSYGIYSKIGVDISAAASIDAGSQSGGKDTYAVYNSSGDVTVRAGAVINRQTLSGNQGYRYSIGVVAGDILISPGIPLLLNGMVVSFGDSNYKIQMESGVAKIYSKGALVINSAGEPLYPVDVKLNGEDGDIITLTVTIPGSNGYIYQAQILGPNGTIWLPEGANYQVAVQNDKGGKTQNTTVSVEADGEMGGTIEIDLTPISPEIQYTLTASAGKGGSIEPEGELRVKNGDIQSFAFTADSGWWLAALEIDGNVQKAAGNSYTFENVTESHTLKALFLPYTDMNAQSWYASDAAVLFDRNVMLGVSDTTFDPNRTANRGMIAAMLWRMEGSPEPEEPLGYPYEDVEAGAYYGKAVYWAQQKGIVNGYSTEKFGPNDPVTREQLAAILYRYAEYKGLDVSERNDLSGYTDADSISAYAREPMEWANAAGLILGRTATELAPKGTATRAETAAMLHRFLKLN